jgi:hypothetical protein
LIQSFHPVFHPGHLIAARSLGQFRDCKSQF